jgi:hypothetical protein
MQHYRVLQLVPAGPGWTATYKEDTEAARDVPVALWALVEDTHGGGDRFIIGVVPERVQGDLIEVAQDPAFLTYRGPDDPRERRDTAT